MNADAAQVDNSGMRARSRITSLFATVSIAVCACWPRPTAADADVLRGLVDQVASASDPDSTAVLVVSVEYVHRNLRSRLPRSVAVIALIHPDFPGQDAIAPVQLGPMFREASVTTARYADVWVVGGWVKSDGARRATAMAELAASMGRSRVLRDSIRTSRGTLTFSRWVNRPGGEAQRIERSLALARADSILARGIPKRIQITTPFTRRDLALDRDSVAHYVARLADTSFYSIGGCSEVELVFWEASERLGQMGPGVVPVLVRRIADSDPFVRERVQEALLLATQDERILARTGGEYLKFYDQPTRDPSDIVQAWWKQYGHFWTPTDSTH